MQFDQEKFKSLVHYVIWKAGKHDWFGATKLNKVLWFADARQYALTGRPITGETYIRGEFGPVPRHINRVRKELEAADTIRVTQEGKLTRLVALIPPDTIRFHKDELVTVNYWIEHIDRDHTAGTISEKSHDYAWEIAKMGEELPYYVYRVGRIAEPTDEDVERLKRRASELGLD
jgi:hypothetical protein